MKIIKSVGGFIENCIPWSGTVAETIDKKTDQPE